MKIKVRMDGTTRLALLALASFHAVKLIDGIELHCSLALLLLTQNIEKKTNNEIMS
jgi:hypothetical protein